MTPEVTIRTFSNDQYVLDKTFYSNFYRLKSLDKPVVVDLGAHCGYFAFAAASLGAKKVYTFEPFIENYRMLLKNLPPLCPVMPFQIGVYTSSIIMDLYYPKMSQETYFDFAQVDCNDNGQQKHAAQLHNIDTLLKEFVKEEVDILKISLGYSESTFLTAAKLDNVKHICGETKLTPEQVPVFKNNLLTKGFGSVSITQFEENDNEPNSILFHFSRTDVMEVFN